MGKPAGEPADEDLLSAPPTPPGDFALLTSPGPAAIAVIRLRGKLVPAFLQHHVRTRPAASPHTRAPGSIFRARLVDGTGQDLDDILISVHAGPPAWDLRLHLHGSPWVVRVCTELLTRLGFTNSHAAASALWPTADPLEAEACALLPRMLTMRGAQWLLRQAARLRDALQTLLDADSLEQGRAACRQLVARASVVEWFSRPARVALVGPPNAGKSTLANALADRAVSLVAPLPGTTRDWVDVPGQVRGFPVVWLDTAGLRHSDDSLEAVAISHTREVMRDADAIVVVLDATETAGAPRDAFLSAYSDALPACVALSKADLPGRSPAAAQALPPDWQPRAVLISPKDRSGLDALGERLLRALGRDEASLDLPGAFTGRQVGLLEAASHATDDQTYRSALTRCLTGHPGT